MIRGTVEKTCLGCNGPFRVMYCRQYRKYCSHACYSRSAAGKYERKESQTIWNRSIKIDRKKYPAMGHFSKHSLRTRRKIKEAIRFAIKRGPDSASWKGGRPHCGSCGVTVANRYAKYCFPCMKAVSVGPLAPAWKGGLPARKRQDARNDSAYQSWTIEVKKRDRWRCGLQKDKCEGIKVAHHILPWRDYPEERYNINNGITLCQYHHPRKRMDEQRLIPELQALVGSN